MPLLLWLKQQHAPPPPGGAFQPAQAPHASAPVPPQPPGGSSQPARTPHATAPVPPQPPDGASQPAQTPHASAPVPLLPSAPVPLPPSSLKSLLAPQPPSCAPARQRPSSSAPSAPRRHATPPVTPPRPVRALFPNPSLRLAHQFSNWRPLNASVQYAAATSHRCGRARAPRFGREALLIQLLRVPGWRGHPLCSCPAQVPCPAVTRWSALPPAGIWDCWSSVASPMPTGASAEPESQLG